MRKKWTIKKAIQLIFLNFTFFFTNYIRLKKLIFVVCAKIIIFVENPFYRIANANKNYNVVKTTTFFFKLKVTKIFFTNENIFIFDTKKKYKSLKLSKVFTKKKISKILLSCGKTWCGYHEGGSSSGQHAMNPWSINQNQMTKFFFHTESSDFVRRSDDNQCQYKIDS